MSCLTAKSMGRLSVGHTLMSLPPTGDSVQQNFKVRETFLIKFYCNRRLMVQDTNLLPSKQVVVANFQPIYVPYQFYLADGWHTFKQERDEWIARMGE